MDRFPMLEPGPAAGPSTHPLGAVGGSLVLHAVVILALARVGVLVVPENAVVRGRSSIESPASVTLVATPPRDVRPQRMEVVPVELPVIDGLPEPVDLPELAQLFDQGELAATLRRVEADWEEAKPRGLQQPPPEPVKADPPPEPSTAAVEPPTESDEAPEEQTEQPETEQPEVEQPEAEKEPTERRAAESTAARPATAESGAELDAMPRPLASNPPPEYPPSALAEGREGRVVLAVLVDAGGSVAEASIHHSSGQADLDAAALSAVRRWRFAPALQGQRAVAYRIAVPIRFMRE